MIDNTKPEKIEKQEAPLTEKRGDFGKEAGPAPEKREISAEDKLVAEKLRKEIDMMELDDNLKDEAKQKAEKISYLAEDDKIKHLLQVAHEKGVVFAVKMAKSMNDPYLLDIFHDVLAREGLYQKFTK